MLVVVKTPDGWTGMGVVLCSRNNMKTAKEVRSEVEPTSKSG
jgi:hypothetical protein